MMWPLLAALATGPADVVDQTRDAALAEGQYAFCTEPARPLDPTRRSEICAAAKEVDRCGGLVAACEAEEPKESPDWLARLARWLGPFAQVLLYGMVGVIAIAIAIPVVGALLQLRKRRQKEAKLAIKPNRAELVEASVTPPPDESDPAEVLREAEAALARGENQRAMAFSLAAALAALGRRGAVKLRRDRTNGEYLRACTEETARPPLREIVRAVDAVQFGGANATATAASRITARAKEIVVIGTLGALLFGCTPPKKGTDPVGDDLPIAVLAKNGYVIKPLTTSLGTMPIPDDGVAADAPVVVLDLERVAIEEDTKAHLMRWVEAGGNLVLLGRFDRWPAEIAPTSEMASTRVLSVFAAAAFDAKITRRNGFKWARQADVIASLGTKTYAAQIELGNGTVLGVANDDLLTNIGLMPKHNAAALVTLIDIAATDTRELRIARPEDGVPPPSNPFAALLAAGLAKFSWHALAAAVLLFLAYGIRHARPRSASRDSRRAFSEHVAATGAFWARARARTHALAAYGRYCELRLREIAPRGADPAAFLATRSGAEPAHVAEIYARALAAKSDEVPRGDELAIIGELRSLMATAISSKPRR
jgi:hypothetical protein